MGISFLGVEKSKKRTKKRKMKFGWTLLGLALAQGGNKQPFNGEKKFKHLEKIYVDLLDHFFVNSAGATGPEAKPLEKRQKVVTRFEGKYASLLEDFELLWESCGNRSIPEGRAARYDKTNWRKAFNQMRNGYNKLLNNELGTCTEKEDLRTVERLVKRTSQPVGTQSGFSILQKSQPQRYSLPQAETKLPAEEMRWWRVSAKSLNCPLKM